MPIASPTGQFLPDFNAIQPQDDDPMKPTKHKPKPMRRRRRKAPTHIAKRGEKKTRRKRRVVRKEPEHAGSRFTKEQYHLIATLVLMPAAERNTILEIVKGIAK